MLAELQGVHGHLMHKQMHVGVHPHHPQVQNRETTIRSRTCTPLCNLRPLRHALMFTVAHDHSHGSMRMMWAPCGSNRTSYCVRCTRHSALSWPGPVRTAATCRQGAAASSAATKLYSQQYPSSQAWAGPPIGKAQHCGSSQLPVYSQNLPAGSCHVPALLLSHPRHELPPHVCGPAVPCL